jgi:hypothetical protein
MPCTKPFYVRDLKGDPVLVPCGMCIDCKLEKARQWADRCIHESKMHAENCFITLTYKEIPKDASLSKVDLQLFIKRLRKKFAYPGKMPVFDDAGRLQYYTSPFKKYKYRFGQVKTQPAYKTIRYYACGEYGPITYRPHYHLCIFGVDFPDKYLWSTSKAGYPIYRSDLLESLWTLGYSSIGPVTEETAGYTARYILKKQLGEIEVQAAHYYGRQPEFSLSSRRPGIGSTWFEKYHGDIYPKDFYHIRGSPRRPPRYYDNILAKKNPDLHTKIKKRRAEKRDLEIATNPDYDGDRLHPLVANRKRKHKELITKSLRRNLE